MSLFSMHIADGAVEPYQVVVHVGKWYVRWRRYSWIGHAGMELLDHLSGHFGAVEEVRFAGPSRRSGHTLNESAMDADYMHIVMDRPVEPSDLVHSHILQGMYSLVQDLPFHELG